MPNPSRTKTLTLLAITYVVSFCSFAYEFVYSELLTVMYGGTVTQYVITVGLYFFSLGIGSALSDELQGEAPSNFFRTEVYLAAVAPAGFMLVVGLNSVAIPETVPPELVWVVARLPAVAVGFLSGFELPLLTRMVERTDESGTLLPSSVVRIFERVHGVVLGVFAWFWSVERTTGDRSGLSVVLAMDYVGGLFGAIVYAKVLYPALGLVPTIFVLALLNCVAALVFVVRFSERPWGLFADERRGLVSRESGALLAVCLLLTAGYAGAVANHRQVDRSVTELYLEQQIESEYDRGAMDAEITSQWTTQYQHVVRYDRTWTGSGPNPHFSGKTEQCLRLGTAVQLCESWADSYHQGLVDVPMSMYENSPETNVLVVGGGDWIAIDHLRQYDVSVDHVDLDGEFMRHARNESFFSRWHDDAYQYDRLNTTVGDGYAYLQNTDESYDLVLLDIPGATDDDLLKLYSKEFYGSLRRHLEPDGTVVAWGYSQYGFPEHHKAYVNTVRAAGFDQFVPYWAWEDVDGDGETERVEQFYVLASGQRPEFPAPDSAEATDYVRTYSDRYRDLRWREIPRYRGVRVNSLFHPNYDILVDT
ncbi:spermidine synthase [Halorussus sp. MSC15.2]|uniref:spermidine synthase n=1 Tax=Halorussus sp. MSC15.2 TaxID=2283638 RepID=UPI0013D03E79|nr:spermidine synthase [Halorussus sp. MSC15.2]NEU58125.1 spermidine synthase [Halorussus sp. MSC15.2]